LGAKYWYGWEWHSATLSPPSSTWLQGGSTGGSVGWAPSAPTGAPPYFRFFPQTFLLADSTGAEEVFIAGDTHFEYLTEVMPTLPSAPVANNASVCKCPLYFLPNVQSSSHKLQVSPGADPVPVAPVIDRYYSSAVIMHTLTRENRILRFGGSNGYREFNVTGSLGEPLGFGTGAAASLPSVEEWDPNAGALGSWKPKAPLFNPRLVQNAVVLPDGRIFIVGGSDSDEHNGGGAWHPVFQTEIYDPGIDANAAGTALPAASLTRPRTYHSVAILLPDARVLVAGGADGPTAASNPLLDRARDSGEIYSPPYLFQGPRPEIDLVGGPNAQQALLYGQQFTVVGAWIAGTPPHIASSPVTANPADVKLVLIRPGSVTHHFDFDQRYLELPFSLTSYADRTFVMTATAPANGTYAPPGYYMLFVLVKGRPSVAATVRIQ
jgi:hypothetical protein